MNNDYLLEKLEKIIIENSDEPISETEAEKKAIELFDSIMAEQSRKWDFDDRLNEKSCKTSEDFFQLANMQDSMELKLKYARKSLKLDPNNLEAEAMVAICKSKNMIDYLSRLEKVITHGEEILKEVHGITKEDVGAYWGILETRPYMRTRLMHVKGLINACMYRRAVAELEELLNLCISDNVGARFILMNMYCTLEELDAAEKLYKEFPEAEVHMLLPLSLLYFKFGDFRSAKKYLKMLCKSNSSTEEFLEIVCEKDEEQLFLYEDSMSYQIGSMEELMAAFYVNEELYISNTSFIEWALDAIGKLVKK